jgi:hypothetical protein
MELIVFPSPQKMVTPLVKHTIIKKRMKRFVRHQVTFLCSHKLVCAVKVCHCLCVCVLVLVSVLVCMHPVCVIKLFQFVRVYFSTPRCL